MQEKSGAAPRFVNEESEVSSDYDLDAEVASRHDGGIQGWFEVFKETVGYGVAFVDETDQIEYSKEVLCLRREMIDKMDHMERRLRRDLITARYPDSPSGKTDNGENGEKANGQNGNAQVEVEVEEEEEDNDPRSYEVDGSVWDAFLIAGLHTEYADFFFLCLVAGMNVLIQIVFVIIVNENMMTPPTTPETLVNTALWRMIIGHRAEYYDPLTDTSLVTRICNYPEYSIMAGGQQATYGDISNYDMTGGSHGEFRIENITSYLSPPLLCIICLIIWILNTIGELLRTFDLSRALLSLPRSWSHSDLDKVGESMVFACISKTRLATMFFMVIVPKFFIAALLGYNGIYYLCYTPSPADLILNALALQCVQDLDEFLFDHLIPNRLQTLVMSIEPIPISSRFRYPQRLRRIISMRSLTVLFLLSTTLGYFVSTTLQEEMFNVQEVVHLLCDGQQNFIYAREASSGMISTAMTAPEFDPMEMLDKYAFRAVLQKTELTLSTKLVNETAMTALQTGNFSVGRRLSTCGTVGTTGIGAGHTCTFPFMWDGVQYSTCTDADYHMPWCYTEPDSEGNNWGICTCQTGTILYSDTTTNKVFEMVKESFSQATDGQECADFLDANTPDYLTNRSLQATFREKFDGMKNCGDLSAENCSTSLGRSFCPETCLCHISTSGLLDREGCSKECEIACDTQFRRDITAVNIVSGACQDRDNYPHEFARYFRELAALMLSQEKLVVPEGAGPNFVWLSPSLLLLYAFSTEFRYWLDPDATISLEAWARESYTNTVAAGGPQNASQSPCKFIEVVYKMFDFDACHPDENVLGGKAGSLRSICQKTCGYCQAGEPSTAYRNADWDTLYSWMSGPANINMIRPVSFPDSCNLYSAAHPTFYETNMNFCDSDVGLTHGFPGWFLAFRQVFPDLDVLAMVSSMDAVDLPTSTTTTTSTTSKTTSTSSTTSTTTSVTSTTTSTKSSTTTTISTSTSTTLTFTTTSKTATSTTISSTTTTTSSTTTTSTTTSSMTITTTTTSTTTSTSTQTSTTITQTTTSSTSSTSSSSTHTTTTTSSTSKTSTTTTTITSSVTTISTTTTTTTTTTSTSLTSTTTTTTSSSRTDTTTITTSATTVSSTTTTTISTSMTTVTSTTTTTTSTSTLSTTTLTTTSTTTTTLTTTTTTPTSTTTTTTSASVTSSTTTTSSTSTSTSTTTTTITTTETNT